MAYALAWYGLANFYFNMGFLGYMHPKKANAESTRAAQRALELNENMAEAHSILASIRATEFDWRGAEREFNRALEIGPISAEILTSYSLNFLLPMRRIEGAFDAARKALELDPTSPWRQWNLGYCYFLARQWERTMEQCEHTLELNPNFYLAHQYLGFVYLLTGKVDEGIQACETAARGREQPLDHGISRNVPGLDGSNRRSTSVHHGDGRCRAEIKRVTVHVCMGLLQPWGNGKRPGMVREGDR